MLVTTQYRVEKKSVVFTFVWSLVSTHTERQQFINALLNEFKDMTQIADSASGNTRLEMPCGTDNLYTLKHHGEDRKALVKMAGSIFKL